MKSKTKLQQLAKVIETHLSELDSLEEEVNAIQERIKNLSVDLYEDVKRIMALKE